MEYVTRGTCSSKIIIEMEADEKTIKQVQFIGGCRGNTTGVSRLVAGMNIDDAIDKLYGIQCRNGTSCPDQLAHALIQYKNGSR